MFDSFHWQINANRFTTMSGWLFQCQWWIITFWRFFFLLTIFVSLFYFLLFNGIRWNDYIKVDLYASRVKTEIQIHIFGFFFFFMSFTHNGLNYWQPKAKIVAQSNNTLNLLMSVKLIILFFVNANLVFGNNSIHIWFGHQMIDDDDKNYNDDDDDEDESDDNKECKTQFGFIMCEIYKKNNQINSYLVSFCFPSLYLFRLKCVRIMCFSSTL